MYKTRRMLLAVGSTAAVGAGLLLGAAGPASAATTETVTISGGFVVRDDDFGSDPTVSSPFSATVVLSEAQPRQSITFHSACAGREVRGELRLEVIRLADGQVYVQDGPGGHLGLQLYEGTEAQNCATFDLDGEANVIDMVSFRGSTDTRSMSVGNQQEGGDDRVSASFRVTHR